MSIAIAGNNILTISENKVLTLPNVAPWPRPVAWWRADTVVKDIDNKVSQWIDISGNGNHVIQNTQANKPLWVGNNSTYNNQSVINFDGIDDFFNGGNILNMGLDNYYIFLVGNSAKSESTYIAKSLAGTQASRWAVLYEANQLYLLYQDTTIKNLSASGPANRPKDLLIIQRVSTGINSFEVLNVVSSSNAVAANYNMLSAYSFLIGAYNNGAGGTPPFSGYYLKGNIAEIIIFKRNAVLSLNNIDSIKNYFISKYAL